jgi:hypothetical protein
MFRSLMKPSSEGSQTATRQVIWPQTEQFYNECKSTDPILVTQRSAVYEPPEDGFKRGRNM